MLLPPPHGPDSLRYSSHRNVRGPGETTIFGVPSAGSGLAHVLISSLLVSCRQERVPSGPHTKSHDGRRHERQNTRRRQSATKRAGARVGAWRGAACGCCVRTVSARGAADGSGGLVGQKAHKKRSKRGPRFCARWGSPARRARGAKAGARCAAASLRHSAPAARAWRVGARLPPATVCASQSGLLAS